MKKKTPIYLYPDHLAGTKVQFDDDMDWTKSKEILSDFTTYNQYLTP